MKKTYHSNGKLLITGEYAILDGAIGLALPTKKGQKLIIKANEDSFSWKSFDQNNQIWYELTGNLPVNSPNPITNTLSKILETACNLNPEFANELHHSAVETFLEFDRNWGLGSSSTLINNIAQWANIDAFELLFKSFGGSGYDIDCAKHNTPILYQLKEGKPRTYPVNFNPPYKQNIFFVYLNHKQNSKEGITLYKKISKKKDILISQITEITEEILRFPSEKEFCFLLERHEEILADFLDIPTIKSLDFPYFEGTIKSLGAWGGDFILAIGENPYVKHYFSSKGFSTIIPYNEMIKENPL